MSDAPMAFEDTMALSPIGPANIHDVFVTKLVNISE